MGVERDEATEVLERIGEQRKRSANRAATPSNYYFLLGMALALFCLSYPVEGSASWGFLTPGLVFLVLGLGIYVSKASKMSFRSWASTFVGRNAWMAWVLLLVAVGSVVVATIAESFVVSVPAAVAVLATFSLLGPRLSCVYHSAIQNQGLS